MYFFLPKKVCAIADACVCLHNHCLDYKQEKNQDSMVSSVETTATPYGNIEASVVRGEHATMGTFVLDSMNVNPMLGQETKA